MARKKRGRKTRRVVRRGRTIKSAIAKNKVGLVIKNLLLFVILALISYALYSFLTNEVLVNLFLILSMVFGFVAVAFLITLLILLIMKSFKKR